MSTGEAELVGRALNSQRMFSWGANSYGQLGLGHCEDMPVPTELSRLPGVNLQNIADISGGGGHTFVLLKNGLLMVCGSNDKGQLGIGSTVNISELSPVNLAEGEIIVKAVGGWDFSLLLNAKGHVFVTGSNSFNQLGLPDLKEKFIALPVKLSFPQESRIVDIAAGLRHGVALSENGHIYQWGRRKAKKPKDKVTVPDTNLRLVQIPPLLRGRVIQIRAGAYFFAGLTDVGEIICWGENNYGQLSISPETTKELEDPHIVNMQLIDGKVTDIQTGWTHMIVLTEKGIVYSFGRANYGQLGRPTDLHYDPTPQPIRGLENVTCIKCGSEHNLALAGADNKLWTWGWNEHGLCGNGNEDNVLVPHQVESLSGHVIKQIGCGAGHSFALIDET